ncbi:MAG: sugar ABC transporter permease [Firmicutes bacterium]|nr:sugar ABC transporter permease [Bacillota bacterium]
MKKYIDELKIVLKENVREYGMFIALAVIMIVFAIMSGGLFLSSRNISNLLNQTGYIAVLAVGMTLIIIIRHIDLSVGFVAGFIGALAAILMVTFQQIPFFNQSPAMSIFGVIIIMILVLIVGSIIGLWNGFLVSRMGIPAFVVTLAGMFLFRGALLQVTQATGTIIISSPFFNAISNGYIPDIANIDGFHLLTVIIGAVAVVFYILNEFKVRKTKQKYQFKVLGKGVFATKILFVSIIILGIALVLATYRGISWTVVIVLVVVAIYHLITNKTVIGRYIYAVGGNPAAAELSGISVKNITLMVFGSMGFLSALSGIMFASRLQSATVTAGTGFELDAIAGAFVGGVSASGGVGKVTGSIIGAIVMASLSSGMQLIGVGQAMQYIVKGLVLIGAVVFDVKTRGKK